MRKQQTYVGLRHLHDTGTATLMPSSHWSVNKNIHKDQKFTH